MVWLNGTSSVMMTHLSQFRLYTSVIEIGPDTGNAKAEDYPYTKPGGMSFLVNCCKKVTYAHRHGMCSDQLHVFGKVSINFMLSHLRLMPLKYWRGISNLDTGTSSLGTCKVTICDEVCQRAMQLSLFLSVCMIPAA